MLVVLLQRHVYGKRPEAKREPTIRNAVSYLLDILVGAGSPEALQMRDDFVTPVPEPMREPEQPKLANA